MSATLGTRIQVSGMTCSGKTTLAARLGAALDVPFTDLDALYWKPGWIEPDDAEWHDQLTEFAQAGRWIVSGNYISETSISLWPHVQTVIWLELPAHLLVRRVLARSWRRWRAKELLWGTNTERFWPHFKIWDQKSSLVAYAFWGRKRLYARLRAAHADPAFAHIRWIRLRSTAEVEAFARAIEDTATKR